jgi:hypothetical protein
MNVTINFLSHSTSLIVAASAMYSASVEDAATVDCNLDFQPIAPPAKQNTYIPWCCALCRRLQHNRHRCILASSAASGPQCRPSCVVPSDTEQLPRAATSAPLVAAPLLPLNKPNLAWWKQLHQHIDALSTYMWLLCPVSPLLGNLGADLHWHRSWLRIFSRMVRTTCAASG